MRSVASSVGCRRSSKARVCVEAVTLMWRIDAGVGGSGAARFLALVLLVDPSSRAAFGGTRCADLYARGRAREGDAARGVPRTPVGLGTRRVTRVAGGTRAWRGAEGFAS